MRSVGLDLGLRHIAFCEVTKGEVVARTSVRSLAGLEAFLGPNTPAARVAFEACREGWHVHDKLLAWGHEPVMLDTTRIRRIGVGQHRRKNDAIDAEVIARALDANYVDAAHVLSPERRRLRAELSVRSALVTTRAELVTTVRGLGRAAGWILPTCATGNFTLRMGTATIPEDFSRLVAPLLETLRTVEAQLAEVEHRLGELAKRDPLINVCATAPSVGLIVAATFVSVIDDAKRFRNAQAVGAYLGLTPSESTSGGPDKRQLGSITKHGNGRARSALVQSAHGILRNATLEEDPLRRWAKRIEETRGKKIAVVALARKLAGVLWAMCRDGTVYDPRGQTAAVAKDATVAEKQGKRRAAALTKSAKKITRPDPKLAKGRSLKGPHAREARAM